MCFVEQAPECPSIRREPDRQSSGRRGDDEMKEFPSGGGVVRQLPEVGLIEKE